jgi:hypothetical protein
MAIDAVEFIGLIIEGVLTLGRGERNDPSMVSAEERERWNRGTYRRGVGWIMV